MANKTRKSLMELRKELDIKNLQEPEVKSPQQEKIPQPKQPAQKKKPASKKTKEAGNILDTIKEEESGKVTRITLDLDEETYSELKELVEYTGKTQAKLLRALIKETVKLLH